MSSKKVTSKRPSKRKPAAQSPTPAPIMEVEPEEKWSPVDFRLLLEDFKDGQRFYLESLQDALTQNVEQRMRASIKDRLGIDTESGDRSLRKIVNSALSAGKVGSQRSRDASLEFLLEKINIKGPEELLGKVNNEFGDDYKWSLPTPKTFSQEEICWYCREKVLETRYQLIPAGRSVEDASEDEIYFVHLHCHMGEGMRGIAQEARSARGLFEKEMRSIRQVLKAYYTNPNYFAENDPNAFELPKDFILRDKAAYDEFLRGIYLVWSETTDVDKAFHSVYWSHLKEYASAILEFRTLGEIRHSTILKKLRKHMEDEDKVQSVFEQFIQNYSQSLSDTGKTVTNPAIFSKNLSLITESKTQSPLAQGEEKMHRNSSIFYAVVDQYEDLDGVDTRGQISEAFRAGHIVVLDVSRLGNDPRQRLMDYCEGLIYFAQGEIHNLSRNIYLLLPENSSLIRMK